MHNKSIAFVNPIVSTKYLANVLKEYNINTIAIYTENYRCRLESSLGIYPQDFQKTLYFKNGDSKERLIQTLKALNTFMVWYGYEVDIALCDELAHAISSETSNPRHTSIFKEDKHETIKALQHANLPYPKSGLIDLSTVINLEQFKYFKYPAVSKPVSYSGAMTAYKFIQSFDDLKIYLQQMTASQDNMNKIHNKFILQEYLTDRDSTEKIEISYSVDTVSYKGKHYTLSVQRWHKLKKDDRPKHYYSEQLLPDDPYFKQFEDYVPKVMDAIGLHNGFGHPEFYLTENGPILIDLNPRLAGAMGFVQTLMYSCLGTSPAHRLGELLTQRVLNSKHHKKHGYFIFYKTSDAETLSEIKNLPSYLSHEYYKIHDSYLVLIVNKDKQSCQADLEFILKRNELNN